MHTSYGGYGRKHETSGKGISHPVVKIVKFCPVGVSKKSFAFFVKVLSLFFENLFWAFLKIFVKSQKIFWTTSQIFLTSTTSDKNFGKIFPEIFAGNFQKFGKNFSCQEISGNFTKFIKTGICLKCHEFRKRCIYTGNILCVS